MQVTSITYQTDSTEYFKKIQTLEGCTWLDSAKPNSEEGRYDILTALPTTTLQNLTAQELQKTITQTLKNNRQSHALPFTGGWIGYLGYEYLHQSFGIQPKSAHPSMWFGWYDWAIIQDHDRQHATLFFTEQCPAEIQKSIEAILAAPTTNENANYNCGAFTQDQPKQIYLDNIHTIKNYILAGDCYQANYTQRFSAPFSGSTSAAYLSLRSATPNPYCAYMALPNGKTILSLSQERFVSIKKNTAKTEPIKGTCARGETENEDRALQQELQKSTKNQAENLMIVDLLRNDFSKNCLPNTVKTPNLFSLKSYANVHHLVSEVTGKLKRNISHCTFILECFPGGSITGAPKKRAMEIINELEPHAREVYCGAIGYFSTNDNTDFNISIRTLLHQAGTIYCWAGGGIVSDSIAEQEYLESIQKIKILLDAITK